MRRDLQNSKKFWGNVLGVGVLSSWCQNRLASSIVRTLCSVAFMMEEHGPEHFCSSSDLETFISVSIHEMFIALKV